MGAQRHTSSVVSRRTLLGVGAGLAAGIAAPDFAAAQSLMVDPSPVASGRFKSAARYSAERGGIGFLVMRHGVILAEDYPNGGNFQGLIPMGAASKAFAPVLAAGLARDRLLTLDEPVAFSLPEWSAEPLKQRVLIRQLLQQTAGLAPAPGPSPTMAEALARPMAGEPGNIFAEDAAPFQVFAELARRRLLEAGLPGDLATYLQMRALDSVGAGPVSWARQPDGLIDLAAGAACSIRALARLGEFIRRRGHWKAQFQVSPQILDAAVIGTLATRGRVGMGLRRVDGEPIQAGDPPELASDVWGQMDLPRDALFALSPEGARLFVIRSRAVVVARAGQTGAGWSDAAFLRAALVDD